MAKNHTITFNITGNENLSGAIKSAQNALKGLSSKSIAAAKSLEANRALLNQIGAYRRLQQSIRAAQSARADEMLSQSRLMAQRKQAVQQLADMRKAYANLNDFYKANKRSMGTEAAQVFKEQLKGARGEIKAQQKLISGIDRDYNASTTRANQLRSQLATQQAQLTQARLTLPSGTLAGQEAALRAQIQATTNALNAEINALERRNQVQANFSQRQQDLANAYSNFQNAMDTAQTIMNPFTSTLDDAIAFEHTMSTLKSISQMDLINAGKIAEAEANMARLEAHAKQLGATTIFTAQEIGEAMVYIARTGWDTNAIDNSIEPILKLAAATRTEIERTADITTNIMTAFGHDISQIEHDTDVFNYTVNHSNQTLEQFGEAMKYVAPVAKLFGATLEETAMLTKFTSDAGVQASMAGTSIRRTMLRLIAPPKQASKALDELGVSTADAAKEWAQANEVAAAYGVTLDENLSAGKQFISIMEQLDAGMAGKSDQEKLAATAAIVGVNAVSGAANIFGAGAKQAKNFTELLENCRGTLDQTYDVMTADTFGAQKSFESAWEAMRLSVGESLLPIAKAGYEALAPMLTSLSQFVDAHPAVVQAAAGIAAAISTIIVAAAGFSLLMAGLRFGGVDGKIGSVLQLIKAFPVKHPGAVALAAAGLLIYANWDKASGAIEKVINALSGIKDKFSGFMAGVNAFIPKWQAGDFSGAIDSFKTAYNNATIPTPSSWGEYRKNEQELDASVLQSSVDNVALAIDSIQNPAYELSNSLLMTSPATEALTYSAQNAAASTDILSASAQGSIGNIDAMSGAAQGSIGNIDAMSGAAQSSSGYISSMAGQADSAAGSLGGLAGAVSSAISNIVSAGANAVDGVHSAAVSFLAAGAKVVTSSNAVGGIYPRGEFLTTFAENSPEAAIPIDNSARSLSLWQETGRMLGVGGGDNISLSMTINISGNADAEDIKAGVYEALPSVERMLSDYTHERRRRAYV